jgi:hypothetical protein
MHSWFWGGKARRKRPLRRPRCGWKENIKINIREIEWGDMDWTDLAQDRTIGGIL